MFPPRHLLILAALIAAPAIAQDHDHGANAPPAATATPPAMPCPMMKPTGDGKTHPADGAMANMPCMDAMKKMHDQAPATSPPNSAPAPAAPHDHDHDHTVAPQQ